MKRFAPILIGIFALFLLPSSALAIGIPNKGMNYSFYKILPNQSDGAIALHYQDSGVRDVVKAELSNLKSQDVKTVRMILNWAHNWVLVNSTGGYVHEPVRTNLQLYFNDIRDSGIPNLIISFGPLLGNDPANKAFNSSLLEENWQFIQDVRSIAKTNGPTGGVTFDLSNEIGPSEFIKGQPDGVLRFNNVMSYITEIWKRYVTAYGNTDASFGTIAAATIQGLPAYNLSQSKSFDNLLTALKQSGVSLPTWYPFSLYVASSDEAYNTLKNIDKIMSLNGLNSSIKITESFYDDDATTRGTKKYLTENNHKITDLIYWPIAVTDNPSSITRSPPYKLVSYSKYFSPTLGSDLNGDQSIGLGDYDILVSNFGKTGTGISGDVNADSVVDVYDLNQLVGSWNQIQSPFPPVSAWWKLDEASGNASDSSGNNLTGVATGTSVTTGKYSNARNFNSNSYVTVSNSSVLTNTPQLTVTGWVYLSSLPTTSTSYFIPFGKENSFRFVIGSTGGMHFVVSTENNPWYSAGTLANSTQKLTTGSWHHLAGVYNGNKVYLYLNGNLVGTGSSAISGNISDFASLFTIGSKPLQVFTSPNGMIDNVKIYKTALTQDQIKKDMGRY